MPGLAFKIRYGTAKHTKVLEAILARFHKSRSVMEEKYDDFRKREDEFLAYMPEREIDRLRRNEREQDGVPHYTTIVVPYAYAQLMTAHTYWVSVFLSRNPVYQYQGRHGEPQNRVQAVEALIDYQVGLGKMLVPMFAWLLDPGKYGFGVVGNYWEEEVRTISEIIEKPITFAGFAIAGKTRKVKEVRRIPGYQGNKIYNVSPRNFFPDTSVPLSQFQSGEFCGRTTPVGWNTIVKRQQDGSYFNVDVVKKLNELAQNRDEQLGSGQINWPDLTETSTTHDVTDVSKQDLLEITIELIPKDWELGTSEYPEKWIFTVANEKVIIGARPFGAVHDQFPFAILEYEPEAYALTNRSLLEIAKPVNDVMTWLVNSHMYNVRQTMNNQFIADPSRISMNDLNDPDPGFIARVKPQGYGQDPQTMIHQMPVADVTGNHMKDMQLMERMIQQVTGVNDNLMGMVNAGGRKTATEVRQSSSFGANRLKTSSEYYSAMGFTDLSQMMLQNTQQYYDQEQQYRIVGDLSGSGNPFVEVTPETIAGFYDFIPVDGTLPVDRFAQANLWRQIFADLQRFPNIQATFDMGRVFSYVAKLAGAKNFDQFKIQAQSPEQIAAGAASGNLVPANQPGGSAPAQIPNVSSTG